MRKQTEVETKNLEQVIIDSIQEKKGQHIIKIDLTKLNNAFCEYFIISHGESNTQVKAIAQNVEEKVRNSLNQKALHQEGYENSQWILLDFNSVIVHVFLKEIRDYYKLEELLADAEFTMISEDD